MGDLVQHPASNSLDEPSTDMLVSDTLANDGRKGCLAFVRILDAFTALDREHGIPINVREYLVFINSRCQVLVAKISDRTVEYLLESDEISTRWVR